eukprot:3485783-Rhodomonas_salina.1
MELCVTKCEVTGNDFGTQTEIPTGRLRFGAAQLSRLSPHKSFKYLGLRMSLTGNTRAEKQHVRDTTKQISERLAGHPFRTDQANKIIE